jgi:hypothetical protein
VAGGTRDRRPVPAIAVGRRWLVVASVAAVFGVVFFVGAVAIRGWLVADEHAYWLAGRAILEGRSPYDPSAYPGTPFAYFYPPPLAVALAPVTALIPSGAFSFAWSVGQVVALWWLLGARRDLFGIVVVVASFAFLPITIELRSGNIHLFLAVLIVLAMRGRAWLFGIGGAVKLSPAVGIVYLASAGRWRDAATAAIVAIGVALVTVLVAPGAWADFLGFVGREGGSAAASLVPVPYPVRAVVAVVLAVIAGRIRPALGEPLVVVAIAVGSPTLWMTTLSLLTAIVGLWTHPAAVAPKDATQPSGAVRV